MKSIQNRIILELANLCIRTKHRSSFHPRPCEHFYFVNNLSAQKADRSCTARRERGIYSPVYVMPHAQGDSWPCNHCISRSCQHSSVSAVCSDHRCLGRGQWQTCCISGGRQTAQSSYRGAGWSRSQQVQPKHAPVRATGRANVGNVSSRHYSNH